MTPGRPGKSVMVMRVMFLSVHMRRGEAASGSEQCSENERTRVPAPQRPRAATAEQAQATRSKPQRRRRSQGKAGHPDGAMDGVQGRRRLKESGVQETARHQPRESSKGGVLIEGRTPAEEIPGACHGTPGKTSWARCGSAIGAERADTKGKGGDQSQDALGRRKPRGECRPCEQGHGETEHRISGKTSKKITIARAVRRQRAAHHGAVEGARESERE